MSTGLYTLALLLAVGSGAEGEPLPGRDGAFQFENPSLEGTVWQGELIPKDVLIFRFERGGGLWYQYAGLVSRKGSWKQTGDTIYLETNNKYAEYRAVLRGNRMIGLFGNVTKEKWDLEMTRQPPSLAKD